MVKRDRDRDNKTQREWRKRNPFRFKCNSKKQDSLRRGITFNLTPEYLESIWVGKCPILGVTMDILSHKDERYAPQIDRINPEMGYVEGNVVWLSRRANNIKGNACLYELEAVVSWLRRAIDEKHRRIT